jgi:serine/threonine protein kinase
MTRHADEQPRSDRDSTRLPDAPAAARMLGSYRLVLRLGEGGMGEVWLAEQMQPVHRRVAVKVIKAGMDTRQVVSRFEAERQALALMDHPAVAKVFDGGATPEGHPSSSWSTSRGNDWLLLAQIGLARSFTGQKRFAEAEPMLLESYAAAKDLREPREESVKRLIELYEAWGKSDQAATWRAKLAK